MNGPWEIFFESLWIFLREGKVWRGLRPPFAGALFDKTTRHIDIAERAASARDNATNLCYHQSEVTTIEKQIQF